MKKIILISLALILGVVILIVSIAFYNIRDRNPGYRLNLKLPADSTAVPDTSFLVGLAKIPITPSIEDTWIDADSNARFEPKKGDSLIDNNQNGKFDAFWLAGFQNNRPATGVHDDLWARTVVWDDGVVCVALTAIDAIGFFHDDVIDVRKMLAEQLPEVDHLIISSSHCHEVPDLMGLWGPKFTKSGVNIAYLQFVKEQIIASVNNAFKNRRPAILKLAKIDSTASDLVDDGRPPRVLDDAIHLMQFCDPTTEAPFGILMNWGNHPETLESKNLQVTADFCYYWLKGIEEGIRYPDELKREGIGGIAIFANGAIGGLMSTIGVTVYDPWLDIHFEKASFDKARAQGYRLADLVLEKVNSDQWRTVTNPAIKLRAKTFLFDIENTHFKLGGALGIFHRGFVNFKKIRSEVNAFTIGPAGFVTVPGEINPELVNGGIEVPEGADFPDDPIELPVIRELMPGEYKFVLGLANDEVGYIMPKTHWDTEAPYTYGAKRPHYGEINSLGPEAGPTVHRELQAMLEGLK